MFFKFCAKDQPLNLNIDKVMVTLRPDLDPAKNKMRFGGIRSCPLDLMYGGLTALPEGIAGLVGLKKLDLSYKGGPGRAAHDIVMKTT